MTVSLVKPRWAVGTTGGNIVFVGKIIRRYDTFSVVRVSDAYVPATGRDYTRSAYGTKVAMLHSECDAYSSEFPETPYEGPVWDVNDFACALKMRSIPEDDGMHVTVLEGF